ncbi:hypothetical protein AAFF27_11000 [Xylophilus sp. GW821-FHT01B05]
MELKDVFTAGGVNCAHIVDDAYDATPTWKLSDEVIQSFIEAASDEDFLKTAELFDCDSNEDEISKQLRYSDSFGQLYKANFELTPNAKNAIFGDFEKFRDGKRKLLEPLIELLEKEGITTLLFGADYDISTAPIPQLLFVDLKLQESSLTFDHTDAVRIVQKQQVTYPSSKPFVFLMSSLEVQLPQMREPFRRDAKLFQSEFEAIKKDSLADTENVKVMLAAYTRAMPQTNTLRESVSQLNDSFNEALKNVTSELRALDLADYFAVFHNTTSVEKTTLGVYIIELLLEYISHEIEGTDAIWKLHDGLQDLKLQKLPRARFGLTLPAAQLYSAGMLHSKKRLLAEENIGRGPNKGYFYLGDIFWETPEANHALPSKAYVVITPACDIARPESMVESLMLCEGDVTAFVPGAIPNVRDALPVVVVRNPKTGQDVLINWDKSSLKIWDEGKRATFRTNQCTYERIGRLRPVYALQLQHAVTSNLSRIGTQRPPSILAPRHIRCYVSGGNSRWKILYNSPGIDAGALAELTVDGESSVTYILSDPTIHEILRSLKTWMAENPNAQSVSDLMKIDGDEVVDALQGFKQNVPKPDGDRHDVTAYPLNQVNGIGKLVAFLPSRNATSPFKDIRNSSRTKKDRETRFLIVFEDKPEIQEPDDIAPNDGPSNTNLNGDTTALSVVEPAAAPTAVV